MAAQSKVPKSSKVSDQEYKKLRKQFQQNLKKLKRIQDEMEARHRNRLQGDREMIDLRNELMSTCHMTGRTLGKDNYTSQGKVPGFVLLNNRRGMKHRKVSIDFKSLGLTRKEAKETLGGFKAKDLLNTSVQFTWSPYVTERGGNQALEYKGRTFSAVQSEQVVVVPFKTYQSLLAYIDLDHTRRSGLISPGTVEHWAYVVASLAGAEGSGGVAALLSFITTYIVAISEGFDGDHAHPRNTLVTIKNITYHNLNNEQPTQDVPDIPFGRFATNLSHAVLDHKVRPGAETWDGLIENRPIPKDMEGLEGACVFYGLWQCVRDSMYLRKVHKKALDTPASVYQLNLKYMWDVVHNRPKEPVIWEMTTTYTNEKGKVVSIRGRPIFLAEDDPDYKDYKSCPDLRTTLRQATRLFDLFDITAVVRDEHGNVLWRFDRTKKNPDHGRSNIDFVARDGHLYLCPNKEESGIYIGRIHRLTTDDISEPVKCSNKFKVPKPKIEDDRLRILVEDDWRTIPDLIARTITSTDKSIIHLFVPTRTVQGSRGTNTKRHLNDLMELYVYFKHKKLFIPEICSLKNRQYGMLRLRRFIKDGDKKGVVVNIQALSPGVTSIEEEDSLMAGRDALDRRIFIKAAMSNMNNHGREYYRHIPGGIIGKLCEDVGAAIDRVRAQRVFEVDTKSQHPYALSLIKCIPIYNVFDDPERYDRQSYMERYGRAVEPYTRYGRALMCLLGPSAGSLRLYTGMRMKGADKTMVKVMRVVAPMMKFQREHGIVRMCAYNVAYAFPLVKAIIPDVKIMSGVVVSEVKNEAGTYDYTEHVWLDIDGKVLEVSYQFTGLGKGPQDYKATDYLSFKEFVKCENDNPSVNLKSVLNAIIDLEKTASKTELCKTWNQYTEHVLMTNKKLRA